MMRISRRKLITGLTIAPLSLAIGRRFMANKTKKMPAIFLGHGSPMNAIETNNFTNALTELGRNLKSEYGTPRAILMISAHWETEGTFVTGMERPKTIHDFYGFPQELYNVQYPASGDSDLADEIAKLIEKPKVHIDEKDWGLDHGTWSVLKHAFPAADIPIVQLSIDRTKPFEYHYDLGQKIKPLREQGVMIMGSGNIVHNLRMMSREHRFAGHDWANEFDEWVKEKLVKREDAPLIHEALKSQAGRLSIPTPEHYLPLLYVIGASDKKDKMNFDYEGMELGSLSMRSVRYY